MRVCTFWFYLTFFYFKHKDAHAKVEYIKRLHEQAKTQIAKKNESYVKQTNKEKEKDWIEELLNI